MFSKINLIFEHMKIIIFLLFYIVVFNMAHGYPICTKPELTEDQLIEIVKREQNSRSDLPPAFEKSSYIISRRGCHYSVVEIPIPSMFDNENTFILNQKGIIVDVPGYNGLKCPNKSFSDDHIINIIEENRKIRNDLPPKKNNSESIVIRKRCVYYVSEISDNESESYYQVFVIDPYGELIDFSFGE